MKYRKQSNVVYYTRYHIVISTKYRRKVLGKGMGKYFKRKVLQIKRFHPEIDIIKVNTNIDHMHIMVSIPPKMSVSSVARLIKTNTGKAMRKCFPFLNKVYWGVEGIWSIGYFVSTVGISEETIQKYIEMQSREDSGQAQLEL